ncbi:MAG: penicillin-binding transpeptidase domain-containing protein [Anaerovoracaceae bacterium]|jgi:peptidoglycan glycosyltransferase
MKKLEARAAICIILALALLAGLAYYVFLLARDGSKWASYPANQDVYHNGYLSTGAIYDRNKDLLLKHTKSGKTIFNDDESIRQATVHAVGDIEGNISTGANQVYASQMVGYNFLTGTYSTSGEGRKIYLTIDDKLCETANEALDGRNGTIGVYNYKTGEIVCMVSSPNYDPENPPEVGANDTSGTYLNKLLSSTVVPGSTFKVITATAALENIKDIGSWSYTCTGSQQYGSYKNDRVTCTPAHGTVDLEQALADSCNCAFGQLATKIGAKKMKEYVDKAGLTSSYDVDGIPTAKGSFEFPSSGVNLAWAGVGQYKDQVNPCSMMVYLGAIANGGRAADPRILQSIKYSNGFSAGIQLKTSTRELVKKSTAQKLEKMLHNDVVDHYGQENFPNLDLCAKSGTAEITSDVEPHSWFVGYIRNEGYPYAFVVLIENGGYGAEVAGSAANQVLQEIISSDDYKTGS